MLLKCEMCRDSTNETMRTMMGCGWQPAVEGSAPWTHRGDDGDYATCPGYSTQLPEVIDIARMHRHWSKGALQIRDMPRPVEDGVEIFDGACSARDGWQMNNKDGG